MSQEGSPSLQGFWQRSILCSQQPCWLLLPRPHSEEAQVSFSVRARLGPGADATLVPGILPPWGPLPPSHGLDVLRVFPLHPLTVIPSYDPVHDSESCFHRLMLKDLMERGLLAPGYWIPSCL